MIRKNVGVGIIKIGKIWENENKYEENKMDFDPWTSLISRNS